MPADREDRRALLLAASAALFGTACSGPEATSDNHAKVTDGMSTDEVLGLMGEPESRGGEVDAGANPKNRFKIEPFAWRVPIVQEAANRGKLVPLRKLCYYSKADYYRNASLCYAQGWAFIYFLNHCRDVKKNKQWGKILDTYFGEVVQTGDLKKAVDRAFEGIDWDEIEAAYEKFIKTDFK